MDSATNEKFVSELMQALGAFLGIPPNATSSVLTDLLYCLEVQVRIMEQFNERPESESFIGALDCLLTVSEKLPRASLLRSYVGHLAGADVKSGLEVRRSLLAELRGLLMAAKRKQRRVFG